MEPRPGSEGGGPPSMGWQPSGGVSGIDLRAARDASPALLVAAAYARGGGAAAEAEIARLEAAAAVTPETAAELRAGVLELERLEELRRIGGVASL